MATEADEENASATGDDSLDESFYSDTSLEAEDSDGTDSLLNTELRNIPRDGLPTHANDDGVVCLGSLPNEILLRLNEYLSKVDKVCFALICHHLNSIVLSANLCHHLSDIIFCPSSLPESYRLSFSESVIFATFDDWQSARSHRVHGILMKRLKTWMQPKYWLCDCGGVFVRNPFIISHTAERRSAMVNYVANGCCAWCKSCMIATGEYRGGLMWQSTGTKLHKLFLEEFNKSWEVEYQWLDEDEVDSSNQT